jgi:BNR repeat-like domain
MAGRESTIYEDEHRYVAHPHMAMLPSGEWLLVANRGPRRRVTMHPPQDPEFTNVLMRSDDEGETWSPPVVVPAYGVAGTECAGLTVLADGTVLLNQWRFRWYSYLDAAAAAREPLACGPEALKRSLVSSTELDAEEAEAVPAVRLMPWIRGGGDILVHRSTDGGRTFNRSAAVDPAPFEGGYGMRGGVVLADGDILLPLADAPSYTRVFAVRSSDSGATWTRPELIAAEEGLAFEEPAPIALPDGDLVVLLRENVSRTLYVVRSTDGGRSWSAPAPTGIGSYPAHIVSLGGNRLVAVAGRRRPPFAIEAYLSVDGGRRFRTDSVLTVRADLPHRDLGYPTATLRSDGSLFVAYYYRNLRGVTGLHATTMIV